MIDPNSLKVTELKAELTARGLPTKGLKKELVTRLEEALASEGTTNAPSDSTSEPDVAPKEVEPEKSGADTNMDTDVPLESKSTAAEAQEIAKITEPIAEPKVASAEEDIIMTAVPEPAVAEEVRSEETVALEPVVGSPSLLQEGLIDTTSRVDSSITAPSTTESQAGSKKRSLDDDGSSSQQGPTSGSAASPPKGGPVKRVKTIEINRQESESVAAAVKESVEADDRRRSTAPSPSPAPGRPTTSVSAATPVAEVGSSPSVPVSQTEERKAATSGRRFDARSMMEKQIKLAAMDRQPDANSRPSAVSPTTSKASVAVVAEEYTQDAEPVASHPSETTRALTITNFVRPLTVNQVKRMLAEFGEIEALWMDSIRTHCYVIFKEKEAAETAFGKVKGQVFPKETGKPLEPHFITPEAAAKSIEAAEDAQKSGKRPVIYTGKEPLVTPPKRGAPIAVRKDDVEVIFKRDKVQEAQVVQPTELFKMTKTQPALYYKPVKEPSIASTDSAPATADVTLSSPPVAATEV
ncbi:hypothetical protein EDD21DRAFT_448039 [Dissophora ornata]|nr:hypothetical protein EDD21DRAFT_448039 [Dissophora ornata]